VVREHGELGAGPERVLGVDDQLRAEDLGDARLQFNCDSLVLKKSKNGCTGKATL
jgi:hypothetical protein